MLVLQAGVVSATRIDSYCLSVPATLTQLGRNAQSRRHDKASMDSRKPPEFTLELSADRSNVKDVVKGAAA